MFVTISCTTSDISLFPSVREPIPIVYFLDYAGAYLPKHEHCWGKS